MKTTLLSFGTWQYYLALDKLKESAKGKVDNIIIYKESDIETDFYIKNIAHFRDKRGFGYWIWKSYFINKLLKTANDDDVFFYVDAGNYVSGDGIQAIYDICAKDEKGVLLFDNRDGSPNNTNWKNAQWTKSDCFNLMGLNTPEYVHGNQVNACYVMFRKTDFSVKFFNIFGSVCANYNIISDAPNITDNFNAEFRDHRHDQSILSLLAIYYKITVARDPSQWGNPYISSTDTYKQVFQHHRKEFYLK